MECAVAVATICLKTTLITEVEREAGHENDKEQDEVRVQDDIEEEEVSESLSLKGDTLPFPALALETSGCEDLKHKKNDQKRC